MKEPSVRDGPDTIGLCLCLGQFCWLLIDVRGPNPLQAVPLLDRWSWTAKEANWTYARESIQWSTFLHGLCCGSWLCPCSGFPQLWTVTGGVSQLNPFPCELLWVTALIAVESEVGHYTEGFISHSGKAVWTRNAQIISTYWKRLNFKSNECIYLVLWSKEYQLERNCPSWQRKKFKHKLQFWKI